MLGVAKGRAYDIGLGLKRRCRQQGILETRTGEWLTSR